MALSPPVSIGTGLAVGAIVVGIHASLTPSQADMKGIPAGNGDVDGAQKKATWLSAAAVAGVSLLAKDPTIFVIGSAFVIGLAFTEKHAIWSDSKVGAINTGPGQQLIPGDLDNGPATEDVVPYTMYSEFVGS